ncbi:MAG: hypothetical protein ACOCP3_02415 [Halodesulfurarchaeum sp.]
MGVKTVSCPICDAAVDVGVPHGGEILAVLEAGAESETETTKTRTVACGNGHEFRVKFSLRSPAE